MKEFPREAAFKYLLQRIYSTCLLNYSTNNEVHSIVITTAETYRLPALATGAPSSMLQLAVLQYVT